MQLNVYWAPTHALNILNFSREAPKRSESFHSTSKDDSTSGPRSRYAYHDSRNSKGEEAPPADEESSRPSFTRGGSGRYTGRQRINRQRTAAYAAAAAGTAHYIFRCSF